MDMDSVISQEQLNMILAGTRDSVPIDKVMKGISSTHRLSQDEKQSIYYGMLDVANSNDPKTIASYVVEQIQYFLSKKGDALVEIVDDSYQSSMGTKESGPSKISPIFRRVG